jgi:hypothetical protein
LATVKTILHDFKRKRPVKVTGKNAESRVINADEKNRLKMIILQKT